jgi:hypothetical protein
MIRPSRACGDFQRIDLRRPIQFADPAAIRNAAALAVLPDVLENAIGKLAEFYSGRILQEHGAC